jgi:hypothetical protein
MNKPYKIQNTNICNGIFHISFFKALLINEGETTQIHFIKPILGPQGAYKKTFKDRNPKKKEYHTNTKPT